MEKTKIIFQNLSLFAMFLVMHLFSPVSCIFSIEKDEISFLSISTHGVTSSFPMKFKTGVGPFKEERSGRVTLYQH